MAASTTADPSRAAQLKEAGNKLYVAKDYAAAYFKYSESIEADGKNAVLYANRAACSFAMSKCVEESELGWVMVLKIAGTWTRLRTVSKCAYILPLAHMNQYFHQATYLDKKYTKAWVRLAASFKARSHVYTSYSTYLPC